MKMATPKLSTGFLNCGFSSLNTHPLNHRLISPSPRFLPAFCKMRPRNLSSHPKRQAKKILPQQLPTRDISILDCDEETEAEAALMNGTLRFRSESKSESDLISKDVSFDHGSNSDYEENDNDQVIIDVTNDNLPTEKELMIQPVSDTTQSLVSVNGERLSSTQLEDLIGMIRNAEKSSASLRNSNILLLNQARIRTMGDFDKVLSEKEALQGELNVLERRLAETDARIKAVAQEKIYVEVLEDQLEKLRAELSDIRDPDGHSLGFHENQNILRESASLLDNNSLDSLNEELSFLKSENISLKDDIQVLKAELSNVKGSHERIAVLEKERSVLESALKELQLNHAISQEDVSKLVGLKIEYQNLWEKVENLQILLDKATKQDDQAVVLQQNQELRKKVERLEESLEEVNAFKLSSEKMEQYHKLMQQKIKLLEEHLERSDEEILACVNLYQESVKEFQDTLDSLKKESKKKSSNSPVSDMPWEIWSRLLLMIDGWLLEKKISDDDAKILRELVWKRNGRIQDAYTACKDKNESEVLSTFLGLTSSPRSNWSRRDREGRGRKK